MNNPFCRTGAVIFDFDGTFYDAAGMALRLVAARPFSSLLMKAERQTRSRLKGCDYGSAGDFFAEFFRRMAASAGKPEGKIRDWYFSDYLPLMERVLAAYCRPYSGAVVFLEILKKDGIPFAVYSDYPRTRERLEALGIPTPGFEDRLYGPENFGALKPAARPFLTIAADLGTKPAEVLVIGDRADTDGVGAGEAGMAFLQVGSEKKIRQSAGRDEIYSWENIVDLFRQSRSRP